MRDRMAVRGGATSEVVTLHHAGKALADGGAGDIHQLAGLEDLGGEFGAGRDILAFVADEAELDQRATRLDLGLGVMASDRLRQQLRALLAVGHLNGAIAIGITLHLGDAIGSTSTTVTGTDSPASVKTRVMPHLRPTKPIVISQSSVRRARTGNRRTNARQAHRPKRGLRGSSGLGLSCRFREEFAGGQPFPIPRPKTRAAGTADGKKGAQYRQQIRPVQVLRACSLQS